MTRTWLQGAGWLGAAWRAVRRRAPDIAAVREALRMGLTLGGLAAFDVAAWHWCTVAGWAVLGVVLLVAEWAIKGEA